MNLDELGERLLNGYNTLGNKIVDKGEQFSSLHPEFFIATSKVVKRMAHALQPLAGVVDRSGDLQAELRLWEEEMDAAITNHTDYKKAFNAFENSHVLVACPYCTMYDHKVAVTKVIMHLNDAHMQAFSSIADWLDSLPYDFSLKESNINLEKLVTNESSNGTDSGRDDRVDWYDA